MVYGKCCSEVRQEDSIFKPGTLLTLGLQHVREDTKSVYWSLPLACLQYYGHPVRTIRTISPENKRVTCHQFAYIVLGRLFDGWKDYAIDDEQGLARLGRITAMLNLRLHRKFDHAHSPTWLMYLAIAAQNYAECEENEKVATKQLVKLGRRWSTFLYKQSSLPPPMFGISQLPALLRVLKGDFHRVYCLRKLCPYLKVDGKDFVIQYHPNPSDQNWTEYASVVPVPCQQARKRTSDGNMKAQPSIAIKYVRWVRLSQRQLSLCIERHSAFSNVEGAKLNLSRLEQAKKPCQVPIGGSSPQIGDVQLDLLRELDKLREIILLAQRRQEIESAGEMFLPTTPDLVTSGFKADPHTRLIWPRSSSFLESAKELLAKILYPDQTKSAHSTSQVFYAGVPSLAALYSLSTKQKPLGNDFILDPLLVDEIFQAKYVDSNALQSFSLAAHPGNRSLVKCLRACAMMSEVYHLLPGAEISTIVLKRSLANAKWVSFDESSAGLTRSQAFACIAMFDSGTCNIDPSSLSEVFALSSGNSVYIAALLLGDPFENPGQAEIRRVVGNVGRPGLTFLIAPPEVKTREADPEQWMAINHEMFDGQPDGHFENTSLHLSFTNYEIPLPTDESHQHFIDRIAVLVETLVSVYDGQAWVGEVDILKTFRGEIHRVNDPKCPAGEKSQPYKEVVVKSPHLVATSVENWDELIEAPASGTIVIKAHQNWLARLAAIAMCVKHGFTPIILPKDVCWACCSRTVPKNTQRCVLIW